MSIFHAVFMPTRVVCCCLSPISEKGGGSGIQFRARLADGTSKVVVLAFIRHIGKRGGKEKGRKVRSGSWLYISPVGFISTWFPGMEKGRREREGELLGGDSSSISRSGVAKEKSGFSCVRHSSASKKREEGGGGGGEGRKNDPKR